MAYSGQTTVSHKQPLINHICLTLAAYIGDKDDVPLYDIIGALDAVQFKITESFIDEHPELVPQLAIIMQQHNGR